MKRSSILQSLLFGVLTCVSSLAVPQPASAQYFGNNFHGDFGVNSGTQSTVPGKGFYPMLRFYSPTEGLFDGTWKLPDVELTN